MKNYNNSSEHRQDKTEWQSVWRSTTLSVLTLDNIKLNDNQHGELQQHQFSHRTISVLTLDKK